MKDFHHRYACDGALCCFLLESSVLCASSMQSYIITGLSIVHYHISQTCIVYVGDATSSIECARNTCSIFGGIQKSVQIFEKNAVLKLKLKVKIEF